MIPVHQGFDSAVHIFITIIATVSTNYLYYLACKGPGAVTPQNYSYYERKYKETGGIYRTKHCQHCNMVRINRSKHCDVCGYCVPRLDHHCIWINCCVGEQNHFYFTAWLTTALISLLYVFISDTQAIYITFWRLGLTVDGSNIKDAMIYARSLWLFSTFNIFLSGFLVVMLFFFVSWTIYSSCCGITTNERYKLSYHTKDEKRFFKKVFGKNFIRGIAEIYKNRAH